MGATPIGGPQIRWEYQTPLVGSYLAGTMSLVTPTGVYQGLVATWVSNTTFSLSGGTIFVQDNTAGLSLGEDKVVRVDFTSASFTITPTQTTYLVVNYGWLNSSANYPNFICTNSPVATDIIVCRLV